MFSKRFKYQWVRLLKHGADMIVRFKIIKKKNA